MLAALKEEAVRVAFSEQGKQTIEDANYKAGLLTGLHRSLELMRIEEQSAGIPPTDSDERED